MSDDDRHITRAELVAFRDYLDEKFRTTDEKLKVQFNKTLLAIGVAVGFIKVDSVKDAGALAVVMVGVKVLSLVFFRS